MYKPLRVPERNGKVATVSDTSMSQQRPTGARRPEGGGNGGSATSLPQLLLSVVFILFLCVGLLVLFLDGSNTTVVEAQPAAPPLAPRCAVGEKYLATLSVLARSHQWAAAAKTADDALKDETLHTTQACAVYRLRLAEKALTSHLQALMVQEPAYLDRAVQEQQVKRYAFLREQVQTSGYSFPTSLEVAREAHAHGHHRLAQVAFENAWREGAFSQADTQLVRQYKDVLFRQGWWLSQGGSETKQHGLRLLAACYALDRAAGHAKGSAWAELRKYLGPNEATWPNPVATPLVAHES